MAFSFENLKIYEKALDFSVSVIDVVDKLKTPRKHFRLVEQLESAATSIPLNIAEGKGRFSKKEFKHFLYIARGSLYETVAMLQIFLKKRWIGKNLFTELYSQGEEINKMLSGLINSLNINDN